MVRAELESHRAVLDRVITELVPRIEAAAAAIARSLQAGGKVLVFGNGGSAADAQHLAAEITGRYVVERRALPAIALTTDTSALTSIANDYGYEHVFVRQLEALARAGDVAIGISTSGRSPNVLRAAQRAKELGCTTIALTGRDGGALAELCEISIVVPADETSRIQEMHILIAHAWCRELDRVFAATTA